jgi:hypothetical protein
MTHLHELSDASANRSLRVPARRRAPGWDPGEGRPRRRQGSWIRSRFDASLRDVERRFDGIANDRGNDPIALACYDPTRPICAIATLGNDHGGASWNQDQECIGSVATP